MKSCRFLLGLVYLAFCCTAFAQSTNASLTGFVDDPSKALVPKVSITAINTQTGRRTSTLTNKSGEYVLPGLIPGMYRIEVDKQGFKGIIEAGLILHVQDVVQLNFHMALGSMSETVTVNANGLNINTIDGSVSTVIDRQFVENMPLNGRSFQSLLTLAPGVSQTTSSGLGYGGEITVNGQRTEANYFTVDGVSANTGTYPGSSIVGAGFSGGTPGETILGTTQSLVSIDALQEFRASTSTYSAEYGRSPGGQFAFTTRSGANQWNGSLFDYFRNDAMDANNWFNNAAIPQVPRLAERQNDFGGVLSGPLSIPRLYSGKDKTFFFFPYEGLRLTVPRPYQKYYVPDATLRQQSPVALQPFLNAFPMPNGGEDGFNDGLAYLNLAYSSPSSLDNYGIRIDHNFSNKFKLFGRYANTPSNSWTYSQPGFQLNNAIGVRSVTIGATNIFTSSQSNDLRFNFTQNKANSNNASTNFGGATPFDLNSLPAPNGQPLSTFGTQVLFNLNFGGRSASWVQSQIENSQQQTNVTDTYSWSHGVHHFKFGIDWRRLATYARPITFYEAGVFTSPASLHSNTAVQAFAQSQTNQPVKPLYRNFSSFAQDEWKLSPQLSLSLGIRWDVNPPPENLEGPSPYTVDQITNISTSQLAPSNTPLWKTDWSGFAPRVGIAYQFRRTPGRETVLRSGFGLFYDTGTATGSNGFLGVGFSSSAVYLGVPFPLTSAQATLPTPSLKPPYQSTVYAFDPNLRLPYTMQWNVALEQSLGTNQSLTLGYVGSGGRRLLANFLYFPGNLGNPNFSKSGGMYVTSGGAASDYDSLQLKFQRALAHNLQAIASYTWSHSIDNLSSNFFGQGQLLRGSSDFDIRHNFQAALTYDIAGHYSNPLASALLQHWSVDTRISASSAPPVDVIGSVSTNVVTQQRQSLRPNLAVPSQPLYISGSQYPGKRILNYSAFALAPAGVNGNTPRNFARGFDLVQMDLALQRTFPVHERAQLQFRAEAFNVFNHANFGSLYNQLSSGPSLFGHANSTLNNSLGGLNSLYQSGGPRSLQLMLKLKF